MNIKGQGHLLTWFKVTLTRIITFASFFHIRLDPSLRKTFQTHGINTPFPIHVLYRYGLSKGMMLYKLYNFRNIHPILIKRVPN